MLNLLMNIKGSLFHKLDLYYIKSTLTFIRYRNGKKQSYERTSITINPIKKQQIEPNIENN